MMLPIPSSAGVVNDLPNRLDTAFCNAKAICQCRDDLCIKRPSFCMLWLRWSLWKGPQMMEWWDEPCKVQRHLNKSFIPMIFSSQMDTAIPQQRTFKRSLDSLDIFSVHFVMTYTHMYTVQWNEVLCFMVQCRRQYKGYLIHSFLFV